MEWNQEPRLHRMFFGVILILGSRVLQHSIASVLQKSADPQIKIADPSFLEPSFQSFDGNAWFFLAENANGISAQFQVPGQLRGGGTQ